MPSTYLLPHFHLNNLFVCFIETKTLFCTFSAFIPQVLWILWSLVYRCSEMLEKRGNHFLPQNIFIPIHVIAYILSGINYRVCKILLSLWTREYINQDLEFNTIQYTLKIQQSMKFSRGKTLWVVKIILKILCFQIK